MLFEGVFRRFQPLRVAKGPLDARLTFTESLAVEQVSPPGHEMSRAGRRFHLGYTGTVPTGIAPVQAFPTTAAQWVIWNGDLNKTHVYTALGMMLFSGTKGLGGQLLACVFQAPNQNGIAQQAGVTPQSASLSSIGSKAVVKSGITITAPALPNWMPAAEDTLAVATVGPASCVINRNLEGRIEVPPQCGLGLAVLAPAGSTPLYLPIAEWIELETDME